jgi:hypothetical protein
MSPLRNQLAVNFSDHVVIETSGVAARHRAARAYRALQMPHLRGVSRKSETDSLFLGNPAAVGTAQGWHVILAYHSS